MFFVSLHSSKRKFAPAQYVNRERFLFPYLHSLFVICSSARATRTVFSSSFLYLPVRLAPSFVRHLFVICSSFVRLLFVHRSSFVRLLFVNCLSARVARTVFCSFIVYLTFPLLHTLSLGEGWGEDILFVYCLFACRATTSHCH